jgi:hypothetical protein
VARRGWRRTKRWRSARLRRAERQRQEAGQGRGSRRDREARGEGQSQIAVEHVGKMGDAAQDAERERRDEEPACRQDDGVQHLEAADGGIGAANGGADGLGAGRTREGPVEKPRQRQADRELDQGQPGGPAEIEVDLQGFEDCDLERRPARPAAERQHDRKALEAQEEDETGEARQFGAQHRPVEMAEDLAGCESRPARGSTRRG